MKGLKIKYNNKQGNTLRKIIGERKKLFLKKGIGFSFT